MRAFVQRETSGPLRVWWRVYTHPLLFHVSYMPYPHEDTPEQMLAFLEREAGKIRAYIKENPECLERFSTSSR